MLYVFFDPAVPGDLGRLRQKLVACFEELRSWALTNFTTVERWQSGISVGPVFTSPDQVRPGRHLAIGDIAVVPADAIKALGATFDINNIITTCYYHLRQLGRIRKNTSVTACQAAVQALIMSRLDYCNVVVVGIRAYTRSRDCKSCRIALLD